MNVLKNELDPHFILNSLTALSHLITNDTDKAQLFTQKLAQAYKYLLINKDRDLISLEEELRFIDNYFFLLQIRHDDKLKLQVNIDKDRRMMILPCALQILIENAIKHNLFTEEHPLIINISLNGAFLNVANNVRSKPYQVDSTNIGLKNLSTRYKLTCNRDIIVYNAKEKFIVKLPII
jgi:LytS/YehU family sensor histidine kinase